MSNFLIVLVLLFGFYGWTQWGALPDYDTRNLSHDEKVASCNFVMVYARAHYKPTLADEARWLVAEIWAKPWLVREVRSMVEPGFNPADAHMDACING